MTNDILLSAIYAGIMVGLGVGIVIRFGASTGGLDIPPLILNKNWGFRWRFLCIFRFHSASVTGCYIDKRTGSVWNPDRNLKFHCTRICLFGRTEKVQVMIISRHYQEIRDMLLQKLDLGATMYHIETGYLQKDEMAVCCVISSRKLHTVTDMVQEVDKKHFFP